MKCDVGNNFSEASHSLPLREKSRMKTKSLLTLKLEGYFGNNENVKIIWYDMEPVLGGMANGPEETKTKQIDRQSLNIFNSRDRSRVRVGVSSADKSPATF